MKVIKNLNITHIVNISNEIDNYFEDNSTILNLDILN
jgi:hypothetical protein